jgi:hypothetical protein
VLLLSCDGPVTNDGGIDASRPDAGPDAGSDAGPMCSLECPATATCCFEPGGEEICTTLRNDPRHCGTCAVDCIATDRGDGCSANQCTCGNTLLGCAGGRSSFCCPARGGNSPYCTNLDTTPSDCGACGRGCDARVSSHCSGGRCVCGDEREECRGTPDSICCADSPADIRCVDTTTDPFHCGSCGRQCQIGERCIDGECTDGAACPGGCPGGPTEICCDGDCCHRARCFGRVCTTNVDAGMSDAGMSDAGMSDAGMSDAGMSDAGP